MAPDPSSAKLCHEWYSIGIVNGTANIQILEFPTAHAQSSNTGFPARRHPHYETMLRASGASSFLHRWHSPAYQGFEGPIKSQR